MLDRPRCLCNLLRLMFRGFCQLHGRGLWQADLHLDNLLQRDGQLFLIDGGGVHGQVPGQPLSQDKVLENLGVLFAQLPPMAEEQLEEVLIHYLLANGAHGLPLEALLKEVAKVRRWRLRDYLKKIGRDCSLFSAKIGAFGLRVVRRDREAELQPLLAAPEAFIANGHRFKGGGAATVARVELNGQPLLVKRYNIKNVAHWCKRFWRPSRAWHSWREGNRLAHRKPHHANGLCAQLNLLLRGDLVLVAAGPQLDEIRLRKQPDNPTRPRVVHEHSLASVPVRCRDSSGSATPQNVKLLRLT